MNIEFTTYWQGFSQYNGWEVGALDLKINTMPAMEAIIELQPPHQNPIQLKFKKVNVHSTLNEAIKNKIIDTQAPTLKFMCDVTHAKTLTLSARIFKTYEDRSKGVMDVNGNINFERRAKRNDVQIVIENPPFLDTQKSPFKLNVFNDGQTLKAKWEEDTSNSSTPASKILAMQTYIIILNLVFQKDAQGIEKFAEELVNKHTLTQMEQLKRDVIAQEQDLKGFSAQFYAPVLQIFDAMIVMRQEKS